MEVVVNHRCKNCLHPVEPGNPTCGKCYLDPSNERERNVCKKCPLIRGQISM